MMDHLTREELKGVLVQTVDRDFLVPIGTLVYKFGMEASMLSPPTPIPTLLAELVVEEKLRQIYYRIGTGPVRIYYAPQGTVDASLIKAEMAERVKFRPADFDKLKPDAQWAWDRALGVLDWAGE